MIQQPTKQPGATIRRAYWTAMCLLSFGLTACGALVGSINIDSSSVGGEKSLNNNDDPAVNASVVHCQVPAATSREHFDFSGVSNADALYSNNFLIRSVFNFITGPGDMVSTGGGVELSYNTSHPSESLPLGYWFRAELREVAAYQNKSYPTNGQSFVYRAKFTHEMPDLYGPVTIFQQFNPDLLGGAGAPDFEVEMTGANQFSNAVPNELQVVAYGTRHRISGAFFNNKSVNGSLGKNELMVYIHFAQVGEYAVWVNGQRIIYEQGVDTRASTNGTWMQTGIYPHGLHKNPNYSDQINLSSSTLLKSTYFLYEKFYYDSALDVNQIVSFNPDQDSDQSLCQEI
ncbi:MAG: hypothetical protein R3A11_08040 [Bdellovibrionota bacterium]